MELPPGDLLPGLRDHRVALGHGRRVAAQAVRGSTAHPADGLAVEVGDEAARRVCLGLTAALFGNVPDCQAAAI
jgi:hypothetical protein